MKYLYTRLQNSCDDVNFCDGPGSLYALTIYLSLYTPIRPRGHFWQAIHKFLIFRLAHVLSVVTNPKWRIGHASDKLQLKTHDCDTRRLRRIDGNKN